MLSERPLKPQSGRALPAGLAALVFVAAVNLRPALTSLGPLIEEIGNDLELGESLLGLLGSLPLLAFAVFSPFVPRAARRLGIERTALVALVLIGVGVLSRSYGATVGLWAGTLLLGAAIAAGNVLVPTIVMRDYRRHISFATGIYSACIILSAALSAVVSVPLARAYGWRTSLAVWAVPAFLTAIVWIPRTRAVGRAKAKPRGTPLKVWRTGRVWLLTAFMGLQSTVFYVIVTWLPAIVASTGSTDEYGGLALFIFQLASLPASLIVPKFMTNNAKLGVVAAASSVPVAVAFLGLLLWSDAWIIWVLLAGISAGAAFVVALSLISMAGKSEDETTAISGFAQSIGYLFAAAGPFVVGALFEHTGTWSASLTVMCALALVQIAAGLYAGRPASR